MTAIEAKEHSKRNADSQIKRIELQIEKAIREAKLSIETEELLSATKVYFEDLGYTVKIALTTRREAIADQDSKSTYKILW